MSTFPPERIGTTFFAFVGFFSSKYARLTAPAGSTTIFVLSIKRNMALTICESSTNTISSINSLIILNVNSPGFFTDIPSAIVRSPGTDCNLPVSNDFFIAGNPEDCTPITLTFGFFVFIARKTPAASPPPPIGR